MKKHIILVCLATLILGGCSTATKYIEPTTKKDNIVAGLSAADFNSAAIEMADDIIKSPLMVNPKGERYIVYVNAVTNDTMQRIDTDQLVKTIRIKLLQSGKFIVTTAFNEDNAPKKMRALKDELMVKQSTVKANDQVIAPDYSLTGKIIQRDNRLDNGDTRIDYYFQLTLTNVNDGLAYWEGERVIAKVADGESVSW